MDEHIRYNGYRLHNGTNCQEFLFHRYIVFYLDILGQSDKLLKMQEQFSNIYEFDDGVSPKITEEFEVIAKPIWYFRNYFLRSIEDTTKKTLTKHSHIPALEIPLKFICASDGMFIWARLDKKTEALVIQVLFTALAASYFMLMNEGVYFRGDNVR